MKNNTPETLSERIARVGGSNIGLVRPDLFFDAEPLPPMDGLDGTLRGELAAHYISKVIVSLAWCAPGRAALFCQPKDFFYLN